jgi:hypothetical protein
MFKLLILNNFLFRLLTAGLLLGAMCGHASAQTAVPSSATVTYNLFRNSIMLGTITEHFEVKDGRYHATSEGRAAGLFALAYREPAVYISSGLVTKDGLRPQRFEGRHRGKSMTADFDWAASKLRLVHDGLDHALDLPMGAQDRLSIMYQLMFAVRGKSNLLDFAMTNGSKLEKYRYAVHPDVTIDVPFKRLITTHLVKVREEHDSGTEVWIAPEYGNVAVKVLIIEDDGVRYEQVATRVELKP